MLIVRAKDYLGRRCSGGVAKGRTRHRARHIERWEAATQAFTLMYRDAGRSDQQAATGRALVEQTATRLAASLDPRDPPSARMVTTLVDLYGGAGDVAGLKALIRRAGSARPIRSHAPGCGCACSAR